MIDRIGRTTRNRVETALPVAGIQWLGYTITIPTNAGTETITYVCEQAKDDSYHWVPVGDGGDVVV